MAIEFRHNRSQNLNTRLHEVEQRLRLSEQAREATEAAVAIRAHDLASSQLQLLELESVPVTQEHASQALKLEMVQGKLIALQRNNRFEQDLLCDHVAERDRTIESLHVKVHELERSHRSMGEVAAAACAERDAARLELAQERRRRQLLEHRLQSTAGVTLELQEQGSEQEHELARHGIEAERDALSGRLAIEHAALMRRHIQVGEAIAILRGLQHALGAPTPIARRAMTPSTEAGGEDGAPAPAGARDEDEDGEDANGIESFIVNLPAFSDALMEAIGSLQEKAHDAATFKVEAEHALQVTEQTVHNKLT